jgi:uncharacterized protein (DUF58 family)
VRKRKGRGLETADIRVFSQGDDIRHLDRNTTARSGIPHVRTFHDEREKTAVLVADFRQSMLWGTRGRFRSVAAAEILAAIGWQAVEAGGRIGLIAFGPDEPVFVPPRPRVRGMLAVAGGLARAHRTALAASTQPGHTPDQIKLERVMEVAAGLVGNNAALFVASALEDLGDAFEANTAALAKHAFVTFLHIRDRFEVAPPPGTYRYVTGSGAAALATVKEASEQQPNRRLAGLRRFGVVVVPVESGRDASANLRELECYERFR